MARAPGEDMNELDLDARRDDGEEARVPDQFGIALAIADCNDRSLEEVHAGHERAAACWATGTGLSRKRYSAAQMTMAVTTPIRKSVSTTTTAV